MADDKIVLMGDSINEFTPKNFTFFKKPTYYDMSELKLEGLKKFSEIIQWGRRNPVKFCERFFGIEFLDYQKYVFMMSWITPNVVWCMSRNAGKTTLGSPFLMAKTMLLPKFEGYILSSTGSQSIGMMKKIESIAKKEIASFTGLTDVFLNELVKSSNSEGFRHDPASYSFKLYSGSSLATVNSNFDGSRGRRSRLNFYDEASYVSEDMFAATLPFVTQNSDFALGGDVDVTLLPPNFPNQVVCASSAGSMDDVFYKRYKEAAMHSMAGDKNYFCADIDCEVILHATYNGKVYPVPLLTQAKIDSEMKMNPTKAMPMIQLVKAGETLDITGYVDGSVVVNSLSPKGSMGKELYTKGTSATATEFAIVHTDATGEPDNTPASDVLTPPTADGETQYIVKYKKTIHSGAKITNSGKKFPKAHELFFKALVVDKCDTETLRAAIIHIPSFMPSPEFTLALQGGDSQTMDYKGAMMLNACSTDSELFSIYYIDEEEEDI